MLYLLISWEAGSLVASGDRKVRTGVISGMERKLRLVIASFLFLDPHEEIRTGLEATRLESNRDEWG